MRKVFFLFYFFCIKGLMLYAQPAKVPSQLHVDKKQLKDANGEDIVLRGVFIGYSPRFFNADVVKWLHEDWGCTVVRANALINPPEKSTERVEAVIDGAIKEGIYVIIDWQTYQNKLKEEAKEFFTRMAKKYSKYPNIIYEIWNEPARSGADPDTGPLYTWPEVKEYSIELISTIRAIDPDNIILVSSPRWAQELHLPADDPITGYSNIMYSLHYYAASHKQKLRDKADYALSKGLPIFISECGGMQATGDGEIDVLEWRRWIDWSEKNKISWVIQQIADLNESCSVLLPEASSYGGWDISDLKESGIMSRNYLRCYSKMEE